MPMTGKTQLNILRVLTIRVRSRTAAAVASIPPPLEHAPVIPTIQTNRGKTPDEIGHEVEGIEGTVVGEEALQYLGADAESERAD